MNIEKINELFKCKFCKEIYKSPVILSCGHKICQKDLEQVCFETEEGKRKLNCHICDETMIEPERGFLVDKDFSIFTTTTEFKGIDFGDKYRKSQLSMNAFRKELSDLENLAENSEVYVEDYFSDIQKKVLNEREEVLNQINAAYLNVLNEVQLLKIRCLKVRESELLEKVKSDLKYVKNHLNMLDNDLNTTSLVVDEKKWEDIALLADFQKIKTTKTINDLKEKLTLNLSYDYYINKEILYISANSSQIISKDIERTDLTQYGFCSIAIGDFQNFSNVTVFDSQFEKRTFNYGGLDWHIDFTNVNGETMECGIQCDLKDSLRTMHVSYVLEQVHPTNILKNKFKIKKNHLKNDEVAMRSSNIWNLSFKEIFENGFYNEKTNAVCINIFIKIDKILNK